MTKIFVLAVAMFFALSFVGLAIAGNDMGAGGPFTSPLIVKDDSPSYSGAIAGQTAVAFENHAKMPAFASGGAFVSPLIAADDSYSPLFVGGGKVSGVFSGEVVAINEQAKTLTVSTHGPYTSPLIVRDDYLSSPAWSGGYASFGKDTTTSMLACGMSSDLSHISVGDQVNIRYEERGGKYIASSADSSIPLLACNLQ